MQTESQIQNLDLQFVDFIESTSRKLEKVVAVIPAYNEERFIGSVVLSTLQYVDTVLIVDDGSSDNTALVAAAAGAKLLCLEENSGKGVALRRGIETALAEGDVEAIVLMDGDGQHQPREILQVVQPVLDGRADVVVGSRFLEVKSDIPKWRQVGQHGLTWITNSTSGVKLTDSQSGFRALSPRAARLLAGQQSNGFSVESEMQFVIKENDLLVKEVPISCIYAEPPKRNPVIHGLQVLEGIFRLVGQTRPMLFFGVPALFLLLAGVLMTDWVVTIFNQTQELAFGYTLLAALLFMLGAIGFSTGFVLQSVRALLLQLLQDK